MSDPPLSSLCTICHTQTQRYKCPRCGARTCSVACIQKHKVRAVCDGVRNPAAYMPAARLRTEAGIDHDYNFLVAIERARERSEKELVEERSLLRDTELRPTDEDRRFRKVWYGDELHHVPIQDDGGDGGGEGSSAAAFDKQIRRRLRMLDIEVLTMPRGMQRQRENKTAFNRRTSTINWQVEWLVYDLVGQEQRQPVRILHKCLEGTPLDQALAVALEWHHAQAERQKRAREDNEDVGEDEQHPRKKRKKKKTRDSSDPVLPSQSLATSTWPLSEYALQSPHTTQWNQMSSSAHLPETIEDRASVLTKWQFFLHRASGTTARSKTLITLSSTELLSDALSGRTIIEFPTIYAIPPSVALPEGHLLESGTRREHKVANLAEVEEDRGHGRQWASKKQAYERFPRSGPKKTWQKQRPGRRAALVPRVPGTGLAPDMAEEGEVNGARDMLPPSTHGKEASEGKSAQNGRSLVDYGSSSESDI